MAAQSPKSSGKRSYLEMYKATTPPWKETIRNRCFTKFQKARDRLVNSFRDIPTVEEMKRRSSRLTDQVMDQEWRELHEHMQLRDSEQHELCRLEEEIRRELKAEEEKVEQCYNTFVQFETEEIDRMTESFDQVLCPVCKKNFLQESHPGINCFCGLWLFDMREALSLARFGADLNRAVDRFSRSCNHAPAFFLDCDLLGDFLVICCQECNVEFDVPQR